MCPLKTQWNEFLPWQDSWTIIPVTPWICVSLPAQNNTQTPVQEYTNLTQLILFQSPVHTNAALFSSRNLGIGQSGSLDNSLALHLEGRPFVGGHAFPIGADVRLQRLPHFLLGVQLLVRCAWKREMCCAKTYLLCHMAKRKMGLKRVNTKWDQNTLNIKLDWNTLA